MPVSKTRETCGGANSSCSTVFRIEKLDDCCATFRVLEPCPRSSEEGSKTWKATKSFFTIDLSCVCAIRCLPDTIVDL